MSRLACVDLPALPLQVLLRGHPEWNGYPVAVVDCDKPQGRILWVDERARASGILPGMRYAAALSLSERLRAAVVPPGDIEGAIQSLTAMLRKFTPDVEPATEDPGVFWLNASGLQRIYSSLLEWARLIRTSLRHDERFEATVIVGFSKFGTFAIARSRRGAIVLEDASEEREVARAVALQRLEIDPDVRDTLFKLGIHTVGDFADLPPEGIKKRFGENTWRLHRLASGWLRIPLEPRAPEEPLSKSMHLDYAEADLSRLMIQLEEFLDSLLEVLEGRDETVAEVRIDLGFECGSHHTEALRPAAPTRDRSQLSELMRLRLGTVSFPDGVSDLILTVIGERTLRRQLELFAERPPRDLDAGHRALARLRAEFGEDAVIHARLREGHLPEAHFLWENVDRIQDARPTDVESSALVRRIYTPPLLLPARPRHEPDGWMLRGLEQGPVIRVLGPYIVSGGWWRRPVHREYHFAETKNGDVLWAYYDRPRRRWFIHGRVE